MTSFHELARRTESLAEPALDIEALVAEGERRLRRRRVAAVVAVAGVVLALVLGGVLADSGARRVNAPIDQPNRHDRTPGPTPPARQIVYADGFQGSAMHFGDRAVRTGVTFAHIDVTDDGFVYTNGGYLGGRLLWFSDGGTPEQIGAHVCRDAHGSGGAVRTANAGSLVAWFECVRSSAQTLVVYDTSLGREVVREQMTACPWTDFAPCTLDHLIGGHVYFTNTYYRHGGTGHVAFRRLVFDVDTDETGPTTTQAYAEDVATHSRGLVVGPSWSTGEATDGIGQQFVAVGSRLAARVWRPDGAQQVVTAAFDTATRREVRLDLPAGYRRAEGFRLFEWLDDDTVGLVGGDEGESARGYGDILTCRLSTGHCDLTAAGRQGNDGDKVRVVPHVGLPG